MQEEACDPRGLLTRCEEKSKALMVLWAVLPKAAVMNIPDPEAEVRQSCQKENEKDSNT